MHLLQLAEQNGDHRTALAGVREARDCLALEARLRGELDGPTLQTNIAIGLNADSGSQVRITLPWKPGANGSGNRLFDPSEIGRTLGDGRFELFGGTYDPATGSGGGPVIVLPSNGRETAPVIDGSALPALEEGADVP